MHDVHFRLPGKGSTNHGVLANAERRQTYHIQRITFYKQKICNWRVGREEMHRLFLWGNLRLNVHMENDGVDGKKILKSVFKKI